ncbi:MAG: hypothetical protein WAR83_10380, partial [Flavobacteriales bacterium]
MSRSIVTLLGLLFIVNVGYSQKQVGEVTGLYPVEADHIRIPEFTARSFDQRKAELDDILREENGALRLYGRFLPVGVSTNSHGAWSTLANGDPVWRIRIRSTEALATELFFRNVQLAEDARLDVFDESGEQHFGGYMQDDIGRDGS